MFISFQDYEKAQNKAAYLRDIITWHKGTQDYITAVDADRYDCQQNTTIMAYARTYYDLMGSQRRDITSSNNRIASNFFNRLNTQRATYSLGNGVTFQNEGLKERLGAKFDTVLMTAAYKALIHKVSFLFWNADHLHCFPLTEFAPLWDEETGALMAGVHYWRIAPDKPEFAVLYELDGWQKFKADSDGSFIPMTDKRPYRYTIMKAPADDEPEIIEEHGYSSLPIVPLYGNRQRQSTLVGMKPAIDAYDLIRSGFANDLEDCAECYWIISNADGMDDVDLARFRDRMKLNHIVQADEGDVTPYTQEIPTNSRQAFLDMIREGIYEDFGALDVHTVAAGATNDHIDAGYQPMDENADDFEFQIIEAVQQILALIGEDDTPIFKRNRISNQTEQTAMVMSAAEYLDDETILEKLPFITHDEIADILKNREMEDYDKFEAPVTDKTEEGDDDGNDG